MLLEIRESKWKVGSWLQIANSVINRGTELNNAGRSLGPIGALGAGAICTNRAFDSTCPAAPPGPDAGAQCAGLPPAASLGPGALLAVAISAGRVHSGGPTGPADATRGEGLPPTGAWPSVLGPSGAPPPHAAAGQAPPTSGRPSFMQVTMKFKRKSKSRMGMRPSDERSNYVSRYS
ncbi:hypothetical protein Taro_033223 [Colocasia esculenta]|uniref:Uncharacterized protein n=1 Tax=Colocasia esculenta TaxID=4460 RepID=A0A843WBV5_COLES|nr:hypothetical protein [Colocasia esculenta]